MRHQLIDQLVGGKDRRPVPRPEAMCYKNFKAAACAINEEQR
jgi:hypothetical protein